GLGQGCSIPLVHLADICGVVIGQAICDVGDTDPSASGGIARRCDCTTAAFAVVAVAAVTAAQDQAIRVAVAVFVDERAAVLAVLAVDAVLAIGTVPAVDAVPTIPPIKTILAVDAMLACRTLRADCAICTICTVI